MKTYLFQFTCTDYFDSAATISDYIIELRFGGSLVAVNCNDQDFCLVYEFDTDLTEIKLPESEWIHLKKIRLIPSGIKPLTEYSTFLLFGASPEQATKLSKGEYVETNNDEIESYYWDLVDMGNFDNENGLNAMSITEWSYGQSLAG